MSGAEDPSFLSYANTCLLTVITFGGGMMYRRLGILNDQLTHQNGRVSKLEEWRDIHNGWARDTVERNDREHRDMHRRLDATPIRRHDYPTSD